MGELALKAKQFETARDHLQKVLVLEPQQEEAHSTLSQVYMALGDKEAASRHARLAQKFGKHRELLNDPLIGEVQSYGATAFWFAIRGGLLLRSGDFKRAAAQLEVAASGDPKNSTIWLDYGTALLGLKRYQEALEA
ncbi:tetratricopeptide repeat protein, partial [bacterium]|nr:tetratricopeptide repeat protein [bacterium]